MFTNGTIALFSAVALGTSLLAVPTYAEEALIPNISVASDVEMPTGDVWPPQETRVYIPQETGSLPNIIAHDLEMPTGDVWPSQENRIYIPQEVLAPNIVGDQASDRSNLH